MRRVARPRLAARAPLRLRPRTMRNNDLSRNMFLHYEDVPVVVQDVHVATSFEIRSERRPGSRRLTQTRARMPDRITRYFTRTQR